MEGIALINQTVLYMLIVFQSNLMLGRPEHILKPALVEPHSGLQTSKLPHTIHLAVVVLVCSMRVANKLHFAQTGVCVHLMGRAQLVVADNEIVRDLLPPRSSQKMLRLDSRVAQEVPICDHFHIILSGHGVPFLHANLGVVDRKIGGDDALQTGPVLAIILLEWKYPEKACKVSP